VQDVRRNGYAFCFGRVHRGVGAIGMLLPKSIAQQPVALAISAIGDAVIANQKELVALMRGGIEDYLGGA
jgi:hypothetical protein